MGLLIPDYNKWLKTFNSDHIKRVSPDRGQVERPKVSYNSDVIYGWRKLKGCHCLILNEQVSGSLLQVFCYNFSVFSTHFCWKHKNEWCHVQFYASFWKLSKMQKYYNQTRLNRSNFHGSLKPWLFYNNREHLWSKEIICDHILFIKAVEFVTIVML